MGCECVDDKRQQPIRSYRLCLFPLTATICSFSVPPPPHPTHLHHGLNASRSPHPCSTVFVSPHDTRFIAPTITTIAIGVSVLLSLHFRRTCFPVNPWQMTRVSLSIQTLALADMDRRLPAKVVVFLKTVAMRAEEFMVTMVVMCRYQCLLCCYCSSCLMCASLLMWMSLFHSHTNSLALTPAAHKTNGIVCCLPFGCSFPLCLFVSFLRCSRSAGPTPEQGHPWLVCLSLFAIRRWPADGPPCLFFRPPAERSNPPEPVGGAIRP